MSLDKLPVHIITSDYLFTGRIASSGQRLQDTLNNSMTDYVRLHDVQVFRLTATGDQVADFREAIVSKTHIDLVILKKDDHEAPNKRLYAHVPKNRYDACATIGSCVVRGHLHMPSVPDAQGFLVQEGRAFFPITDATIFFASAASEPLQAAVVIMRKSAIAFFAIGDRA